MNKKIKTLLAAGLVTIIAGSSVVSSNALSKQTSNIHKTKGAMYIYINGKKHEISLGFNNKPSQNGHSSTGHNNSNIVNHNNQHNSTNTGNHNNQHNSTSKPGNNNGANIGNHNNQNAGNDNVVNKPNNNQSTSNSFLSFQKEVTRLVNVERSKRGLRELSFNTQLSNVATLKSQDMINKNYFSHTSPTYGSPFDMMKKFNISYRAAGENIAMGQRTPAEVVNAWMNSKGHRENILNPNFTDIGVGVAKSSNGTLYWTQMFIGK